MRHHDAPTISINLAAFLLVNHPISKRSSPCRSCRLSAWVLRGSKGRRPWVLHPPFVSTALSCIGHRYSKATRAGKYAGSLFGASQVGPAISFSRDVALHEASFVSEASPVFVLASKALFVLFPNLTIVHSGNLRFMGGPFYDKKTIGRCSSCPVVD